MAVEGNVRIRGYDCMSATVKVRLDRIEKRQELAD